MQQNTRLAAFYAFLTGCLWCALLIVVFLIKKENFLAPYTNFNSYKTTVGEIISSGVVHKSGLGGSWHFDIKYKYTVDKLIYTSNKINFVNTGESASDQYARNYVEKYPVGKAVTVFYDPRNPERSVLEPDKQSHTSLGYLLFLAVMSVIFFAVSIRLFFAKK